MKILIKIILFCVLATPNIGFGAGSYLAGDLSNITSTPGGLLVMLSSGVPDNCIGTPYNWMLIKEENKTMISVALTMWASGKIGVTIYTNPYSSSGAYCVVNQLDPRS